MSRLGGQAQSGTGGERLVARRLPALEMATSNLHTINRKNGNDPRRVPLVDCMANARKMRLCPLGVGHTQGREARSPHPRKKSADAQICLDLPPTGSPMTPFDEHPLFSTSTGFFYDKKCINQGRRWARYSTLPEVAPFTGDSIKPTHRNPASRHPATTESTTFFRTSGSLTTPPALTNSFPASN